MELKTRVNGVAKNVVRVHDSVSLSGDLAVVVADCAAGDVGG